MYAVTGFFLAYPDLIPDAEVATSQRVELPALTEAPLPETPADPASDHVASILVGELGLRGRLEQVRPVRRGWAFTFRRPGTEEIVRWTPGDPEVVFRTRRAGLRTVFNRLHHLHGYAGGLRFWIWAVFLDLVSLAMFFFAGTGVYLWLQAKKDRRLGWILLGGSTLFVIGSLAHLLLSK